MLFLSSGCTPKGPESTPTPVINTTPTTAIVLTPTASIPVQTITPTFAPTPTPGITEKRIGYVGKVYTKSGINYIDIDYVNFLTGTAAVEAAKEDGYAEQDELGNWYVPNDYYITNDNKTIRTFQVGLSASIKIVDLAGSGSGIPMKSITFAKLKTMGPTFADGVLLMHVDVVSGIVQSLEEQFRP